MQQNESSSSDHGDGQGRQELAIRAESMADATAVRHVNELAFGQPDEADLVDRLRRTGHVVASLVAEIEHTLVGHILFSRLPIDAGRSIHGAALAPVAVLPRWQRQGIGSALIRAGLHACRAAGIEAVIVLGHPGYYPRFGFSAALAERLRAPFAGPAFMALELVPDALRDGGQVRYPPAFFV